MVTIGLPAEVRDGERRVALDPAAVSMLTGDGLAVRVETGAGREAGFTDGDYQEAGARLVGDAADAWASEVVCKVKEPQPFEWAHFRPGLRLFCYLHLAADPSLTGALIDGGVEAHAFETVIDATGLPLLAPMSEIAGRVAAISGAAHLATGSGVLVGGAAGVPPARAVVVGLGVAGGLAARGLRGMDADVTGIDVDLNRLRATRDAGTVAATVISSPVHVAGAVADADLVIGAALIPGAKAPTVVTKQMISAMRPGSVVVDLAIDQGGCVETAQPTSLSAPTYVVDQVVHYCAVNVPGQYPRTASRALSAAVAPRLRQLAQNPEHPLLDGSLNVADGRVRHPAVAAALGAQCDDPNDQLRERHHGAQ